MRVTVMYNPQAGDARTWKETEAALRRERYTFRRQSTKVKGWERALEKPADVVLAVGGDGTVAKVAKALRGTGVPMAIVPVGIANNIARSLSVRGTASAIVEGLPTARRVQMDLGVAVGPWGEEVFVESVGLGIFAHLLATAHKSTEREIKRSLGEGAMIGLGRARLLYTLFAYRPRHWRLTIDDERLDLEGVWLSVMNIRSLGPRIIAAPRANAADGLLDVVMVSAEDAGRLADTLMAGARGDLALGPHAMRRARRVIIGGDVDEVHIDDEPRRPRRGRGREIWISPLRACVDVLLP